MTETYKPRYRAGDLVASTNSGTLYCIQRTHALDAVGSFAYTVRSMVNGRGYGPVRNMAESSFREPSDRALELHRAAASKVRI